MTRPFAVAVLAAWGLVACSQKAPETAMPRGELRPYVTARDTRAPSPSWFDDVGAWFVGDRRPAPATPPGRR
jgi:hypothetical protein